MKRIILFPTANFSVSARPIHFLINYYWDRSANGFGIYTQPVSEPVYRRIADNAKLYSLEDKSGKKYLAKPVKVGSSYFVNITPEKEIEYAD